MSRAWEGSMPTKHLSRGVVAPIQFRRWDDATRDFKFREKDRETVEEYMKKISEGRKVEPIHLGVSDWWKPEKDGDWRGHVYVRDGHHRAVAHMKLGTRDFPFVWSWIKSYGGTTPVPDPFPIAELLP